MKNPDNYEVLDKYEAHLKRALGARKVYRDTIAKAVANESKGYLSIIVDAGGGSGCTHIPRFATTEKGLFYLKEEGIAQ